MRDHLSSRLLSTDVKIKIYRSTKLLIVSCGFETWYVTGGGHRLGLFGNWMLMSLLRGEDSDRRAEKIA